MKTFLTAHWGHLLLLNYSVDPSVLQRHLPEGCELDLFEGKPYVSLVAFQFTQTKVFGVRWPGFTNFPELNLRFYIKYRGERGVCFIREFVPSRLVAGIARVIYNEPYKAVRMWDRVWREGSEVHAEYGMRDGLSELKFEVVGVDQPHLPASDTREHFFKEHELGVGRNRRGETVTYNVHHPFWQVFPVKSYRVSLDAVGLYGEEFADLSTREPDSVVFAVGSEITVYQLNG